MAAGTRTIALSGNHDIDALLEDHFSSGSFTPTIWNTGNLTFSLPASASFYNYAGTGSSEPSQSFQAITSETFGLLPDAITLALGRYSMVANLTFTPTTETSSAHADLRFAVADLPASRGYSPGDPTTKSGDVWYTSEQNWTGDLFPGSENFVAVMHEIGHALGLSHPGLSMDPSHVGWD